MSFMHKQVFADDAKFHRNVMVMKSHTRLVPGHEALQNSSLATAKKPIRNRHNLFVTIKLLRLLVICTT